jgi:hypothetical protein
MIIGLEGDEVTAGGRGREVHNEELHNSQASAGIITMNKRRR